MGDTRAPLIAAEHGIRRRQRAALLDARDDPAHVSRVDVMAARFDQAACATRDGLVDGSLPQLNTLLRELTSSSRRLGRLLEEIESAPQMLLLGRSEREPGPGEAGFDAGSNPASRITE